MTLRSQDRGKLRNRFGKTTTGNRCRSSAAATYRSTCQAGGAWAQRDADGGHCRDTFAERLRFLAWPDDVSSFAGSSRVQREHLRGQWGRSGVSGGLERPLTGRPIPPPSALTFHEGSTAHDAGGDRIKRRAALLKTSGRAVEGYRPL